MAFDPTISNKIEVSMNVSALKSADPELAELIDHATHVVVYSFKTDNNEWEKVNIEGALFVYSRKGEPKFNLIVVNRLSTANLMEPLNEEVSIQVQEPFLLYRNNRGSINGIWFYNQNECCKIAASLKKIITDLSSSPKTRSGMDMLSLLGKSDNTNDRVPNKVSDVRVPDGTSKRVLDFFAMASSSAPSQPPSGYSPRPPGTRQIATKFPNAEKSGPIKSDVKPLLQRLLSNPNQPVQTVEQIEKQHRSTTPKKDSGTKIPETSKKNEKQRPKSLQIQNTCSVNSNLENGFGFMRISESSSCSPPNATASNCILPPPILHSPLDEPNIDPIDQGFETPSKLALIPPNMFASSSKKETEPVIDLDISPQPLTKAQLLQAVSYLLKNDADFVNKLHEAYVKSFVGRVS